MVGAFIGALIVRYTYADQIRAIDPDHTKATQGIFSTSPGRPRPASRRSMIWRIQ